MSLEKTDLSAGLVQTFNALTFGWYITDTEVEKKSTKLYKVQICADGLLHNGPYKCVTNEGNFNHSLLHIYILFLYYI